MPKLIEYSVLLLILLLAAVLRWTGLDWDAYHHYHPDERYITWVATSIEWPTTWETAFSPTQSSLNPYYWPPHAESKGIVVPQDEPRKFAYGHFPLYLGVAVTRLMETIGSTLAPRLPTSWVLTGQILNADERVEFIHLTAVTRALTGFIDLLTVWVVYLIGKQLYDARVGLLAAAFLALNVMHIQLAHFFAFDPYMTLFVVTAIYCMVLSVNQTQSKRKQITYLLLGSVLTGLAIGSKFAAILLLLPLGLTAYLGLVKWRLWWLTAVIITFFSFALTNPFALIDYHCDTITPSVTVGPLTIPALNWKSCYLDNITTQSAMVQGRGDIPFTRQYDGTWPYLYYIEMQLKWGMGPLLGLASIIGFGWVTYQIAHRLRHRRHTPLTLTDSQLLILLAWCLPFFLTTGNFHVKFMRYLQPLVPFLMIFAAAILWHWPKIKWQRLTISLTIITTGLYAWSFVNLYQQPHPWVTASQWIFTHIEPETTILSELWDDALPSSMSVNGRMRRRNEYQSDELTWHQGSNEKDNIAKLTANLERLANADYLTLASNRIYGVDPRIPQRLPISSQYHQLLFNGQLGYEPVFVIDRNPTLFGLTLRADTFTWPGLQPPPLVESYLTAQTNFSWGRADESFLVYDQPLTIIFQKTEQLSVEEMITLFELE